MAELSLCMIVRDESEVLARCLESIAPAVDEIVVVDTGSVDDTVEIARSFGARVEPFEWIDDFAAARNRSFELAACPYILWLDADDVVLPAELEKLLDLKPRLEKDVYWMSYDYRQDLFGACTYRLRRDNLVRHRPGLRWRSPVHEFLDHGWEVSSESVDITLSHRPTRAGRERDKGRNLRILEKAVSRPEAEREPWIEPLLAQEYQANGFWAEALAVYEQVEQAGSWADNRSYLYEYMAHCHHALSREEPHRAAEHRGRARLAARKARRLAPGRAEPCLLLGRIEEEEGRLRRAVSWYERALLPLPDGCGPVAPFAYTVAPAERLSSLWRRLGNLPKARHYNEMAIRWHPSDPLLLLTRRALQDPAERSRPSPSRSDPP